MKKFLSLFLVTAIVFGIALSCPFVASATSSDLTYELNSDGKTYYVEGYSGTAKTVTVPATYNGKSVTEIGSYAFAWSEVENVNLPDTIIQIDDNAFYYCENLKTIDLGDALENIRDLAFYSCTALERIEFPAKLSSIGMYAFSCCSSVEEYVVKSGNGFFSSQDGVLFNKEKTKLYKYPAKSSAKTYVIPTSVKNIEQFAFGDCANLEEVTLSCDPYLNVFYTCPNLKKVTFADGATSIGDIFYDCPKIEEISISETVESISVIVLSKMKKLSKVTIDSNNPKFTSQNGAIFSKDNTKLYLYLSGNSNETFSVPLTVTTIESNAFARTQKLKTVEISENVSQIGTDEIYDEPMLILENSSVSAFDVEENNAYYSSIDGVLFSKNKKTLLCYPANKSGSSYKIPATTETIRKYAIYAAQNLKTVNVPKTVKTIGDYGIGYYFDSKSWGEKVIASFVIEGAPGSIAQSYAKSNGIKFVDPNHVHKYTTKITKAATVNSKGTKKYTCSCGYSYTKTINQLKCSKPKLKSIGNNADGVKITWSKVSGADKYYVYRKKGSGSYSNIGKTTKTYYTDKKAKSGVKYSYVIKAVNEAGKSDSSSSKSILYLEDTKLKTPLSSKSGIKLKWGKISGAKGYMVYRKTGSGSYKKIATVKGGSKVSYTDKSAKKGKTYTYKIKVYNGKTYSAYSNTKKIKDKY